jgi:Ca2+-binding RTX toxin-like protein
MIANVEEIVGGAGVNSIVLTGTNATRVDLGTGDDIITFGYGQDSVTGGTGADSFVFTDVAQSAYSTSTTAPIDVILDFIVGTDTLVFEGLESGTFNYLGSSTTFTSGNTNSEAYFVNSTDRLYVDVNGDNVADMIIKLTGINYDDLSLSDFEWS